MAGHWKRIINNQYGSGNLSDEGVQAFVPERITQNEADEILGGA